MPESTPTASWPSAAGASTALVKRRFSTVNVGKSNSATQANSGWTTSRLTREATANSTTDMENANGMSMAVATSTSASAWASRRPAGRERWKSNGASRNLSVTASRHVRWVLAIASMLNHRRTMIDVPRTTPIPTTVATATRSDRRDTPPPSRPGTITSSVTRPTTTVKPTTARANTLAPMMAVAWASGWVRIDSRINRQPRLKTLDGTAGPAPGCDMTGSRGLSSEPVGDGRGELRAPDLRGVIHQTGEVVGHDPVGDR